MIQRGDVVVDHSKGRKRNCSPTESWDGEEPGPHQSFPTDFTFRNFHAMEPTVWATSADDRNAAYMKKVSEELGCVWAATPAFAPAPSSVVEVVYETMPVYESTSKEFKKAEKLWWGVENRANAPEAFSGKLHMRREPIRPDMIVDFMGRTSCRRATHPQRGSLFTALDVLLRRVHPEDVGPLNVRFIRVAYQRPIRVPVTGSHEPSAIL